MLGVNLSTNKQWTNPGRVSVSDLRRYHNSSVYYKPSSWFTWIYMV